MDNRQAILQTDTHSDFSATAELLANERCLKNYNADIVKKITKGFLQPSSATSKKQVIPATTLEFGAGTGALATEYLSQNNIKPDCIEIDKEQIKIIKDRGFTCFDTINNLQTQYDAIYTSNVLEHIEDDVKTLRELRNCLKINGRLAIYVPAFMCLWSEMDTEVGHYRRYTRSELRKKVEAAGYNVLSCYYVDSVGFFAWLYMRFKGYKPNQKKSLDRSLKFFDLFLYPVSRMLDILGLRYLFGKNVLLIAEKIKD